MTDVYLEIGKRRSFASAVDWPGWTRAGRDPEVALAILRAYEPRYANVLRQAGIPWEPPGTLEVVERIQGDAGTDFGVPSRHPQCDLRPLGDAEAERLTRVLRACWEALRRIGAAAPKTLRKGPRGGGRELPAVLAHVAEADYAYVASLGLRLKRLLDDESVEQLRSAMIETVRQASASQGSGAMAAPGKRWTPRYLVRRAAWHALDHAWEIEDRSA